MCEHGHSDDKRTEKGSCLDTWIDCNLIRVPLGTIALKEGAVAAVVKEIPKEKIN
jgi:hypothetical protein